MEAVDHGHIIFEVEMQPETPERPTPVADIQGTTSSECLFHRDSAVKIKAGIRTGRNKKEKSERSGTAIFNIKFTKEGTTLYVLIG